MSDQDDWEFAGPDDAKAEIRAAVGYLLRGATGGARGDIVQEIIAIVRQIASGLPPEQGNPLDDGLPGGWPGTFLTKHSATPAKPFSSPSEALRKRTPAINGLGQTTGSIMWASILNSIYREFLRTSLSGMHKLAAAWWISGRRTEAPAPISWAFE
jgi:hypothetical protein